mgnify:FL=1
MIDVALGIIIVASVVFNITSTVRYLAGPFDVFTKLLLLVGIERLPVLDGMGRQIGVDEDIVTPNRFITKLFACFWCLSTWMAAGVTIIYGSLIDLRWWWWIFIWMGATGISGYANERISNNGKT